MKAAAVLARLLLCLALVAGAGASAFAQNITNLKQKADQGVAYAQYELGHAYSHGDGIKKDDTEATKWFRLAAEQGDTRAQARLGGAYRFGYGVEKDYYKAYVWYSLAGKADYAESMRTKLKPEQIKEGFKNLPPSLQKKAKQAFAKMEAELKAKAARAKAEAEAKAANAEVILNFIDGIKYEYGDGVLPNYKEAARLYELAAEQGHVQAQLALGLMYLSGKGVAQDYGEAYIWLALVALNADDNLKEDAIKQRLVVETNLTTDEINKAQAEAAERLEEIKKRQAAAK